MAINSFPAGIKNVIEQTNFLEREFKQALDIKLAYRFAADKEPVPNRVGETVTKSRAGLRPTITAALSPASLGNFDDGLSSSVNAFEQYTVAINLYGDTIDLNTQADKVLIANLFLQNVKDMANQSARSLDGLAAVALHTAYEAGNSYITANASASTTVHVDNVNGFDTAYVYQGNSPAGPQAVSASNKLAVSIYAGGNMTSAPTTANVTAVAVDGSNTSSAQSAGMVMGRSGTLTLDASVTVSKGDVIVANDGAYIVRAGAKGSRFQLATTDQINLQTLVTAKAKLEGRGVEPLDSTGRYMLIIDPQLLAQLWLDSAFQRAAEGGFAPEAFREGVIRLTIGMDVVTSNFVPAYAMSAVGGSVATGYARHGVVVGKGALVEAPFAGAEQAAREAEAGGVVDVRIVDNIVMITRPPMDRLGLFVAQSWMYTGGFVCPTDVTSNPNTIPSSDFSRYKRAVLIEAIA